MSPSAAPFDLSGLSFRFDQVRRERGVSLAAVAREIGVASSTIRRFGSASDAEADGVLAVLGWLGEIPETFIEGSVVEGVPLPVAGDGCIRVDMESVLGPRASGAKRTRTTIQRLAVAAQNSDRPIAALTRWSEI